MTTDDNTFDATDDRRDPGNMRTTSLKGESESLPGISDLFGVGGSRGGTAKPASPTSGFTSSGLAPTALYVPLPDDATPRTLQGRYRLVAELGMGGMGVTYRAWDSQDGVPVVIKMPRKDVRANPEIMDRFSREVRTMLELSHEHIVPITDHGEEEGCPFVAMRFLPGGSLSEYRGKDEAGKAARLSPATLHFWLPGIARALDFMHSSGVLHRDVKPGNIFLDGFLKPFLGDFGIAKVVDETAGLNREYTLTATRMAVGTPEYMAPELFRPGVNPDGRVDQYALAVTVYEMLAGRKPFRGDSAHIIVEHASKDVPPLEEFCPDAPASLVEAVHKALAKNPDDRFTTCSEFTAAVLAEAPALNIDTSRARLLCPSCRAILRVSETTAGKRGTCPKCKSPVAVAQDLGSLWLAGEDRSAIEVGPSAEFVTEEQLNATDSSEDREELGLLVPTTGNRKYLVVGLVAAIVIGAVLASIWLAYPFGNTKSRSWLWVLVAFAPHVVFAAAWFVAGHWNRSLCDRRLLTPGVMFLSASFLVLPIAIGNGWPTATFMWWLSFTQYTGLILVFLGHSSNRIAAYDFGLSEPSDPVARVIALLFGVAVQSGESTICFQPLQNHTSLLVGGSTRDEAACRIDLPNDFAELLEQRIKQIHRTCLLRESDGNSGLVRLVGISPMFMKRLCRPSEFGEIVSYRIQPLGTDRDSGNEFSRKPVKWEQLVFPGGLEPPWPMFISDVRIADEDHQKAKRRNFLALVSLWLNCCHVNKTSAMRLSKVFDDPAFSTVDVEDVLDKAKMAARDDAQVTVISEALRDIERLKTHGSLYFIRADAEARRLIQKNILRVAATSGPPLGMLFTLILGFVFFEVFFRGVLGRHSHPSAFVAMFFLSIWLIYTVLFSWFWVNHRPQLVEITDHSFAYAGQKPILLSEISYVWIAKPKPQDSSPSKPVLLCMGMRGIRGLFMRYGGCYSTVFENFAEIRKAFEDRGVRVKV